MIDVIFLFSCFCKQ